MALDLAYDPAVPAATLRAMERTARQRGLPLEEVERLGQDARACRAFVEAARRGDERAVRRLAEGRAFLRGIASPSPAAAA